VLNWFNANLTCVIQMYETVREWQFDRRLGKQYRAVFVGYATRKTSFTRQDWECALIYKSFRWNSDEYETLRQAITSVGDSQMIITSIQSEPPHRWSCVVSTDRESYLKMSDDPHFAFLPAVNKAMFSPSGKWGILVDEGNTTGLGYAVVSGEPEFMTALVSARGGSAKMKDDFTRLLNDPFFNGTAEDKKSLLADANWA
jgi:hypothetical protein